MVTPATIFEFGKCVVKPAIPIPPDSSIKPLARGIAG
jgi:hypothetical protein